MKRLFAVLLAVCLITAGAYADVLTDDWKNATDAELQNALAEIQAELQTRGRATQDAGDGTLYEGNGVKITMTGETHLFVDLFYIGVIVENDSDRNIMVSVRDASVNGWETSTLSPGTVQAGNKKQADMTFNISKAGIATEDEIQNISFYLTILDSDSFELIGETEKITYTR